VILHVTRPHKKIKDVVTRRVFKSPDAFAAGLRPDPLRELQRSSRSPGRNRGRGPTSEWRGKGRGEREGKGVLSSLFYFWLRACKDTYRKTPKLACAVLPTDRYIDPAPHNMRSASTRQMVHCRLRLPPPAPLSRWTRLVSASTKQPIRRSRGVSLRTTTQ